MRSAVAAADPVLKQKPEQDPDGFWVFISLVLLLILLSFTPLAERPDPLDSTARWREHG